VSRLEFRAEVADARPPSAWALASVAGAMLWITQQLAWWTVALQVAAILGSLALRRRPLAVQRSPVALNVGMMAIVAATIWLALGGHPATVNLAHFAALTQGLQLLDARPRKSEFLLVALSLFQVILASNLTDSLLFPPLLVVFLVATTWTLLVHTLRSEAIEAGDAPAAGAAINAGLLRMTLVASVASLALALVLFVMLPRLRSNMIQGGLGGDMAVAGFSDRVELGTIGRIRQDPTVVLRVETLRGETPPRDAAYWRGLAFDRFDGRRWSISTPSEDVRARRLVPGAPRFGLDVNGGREQDVTLVQRVIREPVEAGVLFSAGVPRHLQGGLERVEADPNGGLYAPRQVGERIRYTISTTGSRADDAGLARDRALPPRRRDRPRHPDLRFLELPDLAPQVETLAREITAGAASDAGRARALERWLRRQGRYTDAPPDMEGAGVADGSGRSPVERFLLGELAGHCEYFASGMVVLARSVGLPARLVNGFAGGRRNAFGGFVELARSDAHAWVEVHYEDAGWVRYDPTPPDLRLRAAAAASLGERLTELYSAVETWWFQRVVDFDSADQIRSLKAAWRAWRGWSRDGEHAGDGAPTGGSAGGLPDLRGSLEHAWPALLAAAAGVGLVLVGRRRAVRERPVPRAYARALRLLARRGLRPGPSETARGFALEVSARLPDPAAAAFGRLTEGYLAERFGGREAPGAGDDLERLRRALRGRAWPAEDQSAP